jgi:hypothetical protein
MFGFSVLVTPRYGCKSPGDERIVNDPLTMLSGRRIVL